MKDGLRDAMIVLAIGIAVAATLHVCISPASADALPVGTVSHMAYEASHRYGMPVSAADRLVCIAWHESRFDPQAVSRDGWYYGMMQFGQYLWMTQAPSRGYDAYLAASLDAYAAIDTAAYIASRGGWRNWGPVVDGRC